ARTATAQGSSSGPFALKGCDDPKVPIGMLSKAGGTIAFKLSKDGKPDIESLNVTKLLGMSVAGFKSAVSRQLGGCRFEVPKGALNNTVIVSADATTEGFTVSLGAATPGDVGTPLAVEPFTLAKDTMPFQAEDRRVDERPRKLGCTQQVRAPTVIHASGSSAAAAQQDLRQQQQVMDEQYRASHAGRLTAVVRVSADGKPGSQIRVVEITNPPALQNLGDYLGSCRFAPGRILGQTVPTLFETSVAN
ncbi:MAG: hypothetical protein ABUL71_03340, partial [Gemmatimonadota bacterium]